MTIGTVYLVLSKDCNASHDWMDVWMYDWMDVWMDGLMNIAMMNCGFQNGGAAAEVVKCGFG
jgi:hypothetical protein